MSWSEDALLKWLAARGGTGRGLELGRGDDAALVRFGSELWSLAIDQVIEGVHFEAGTAPARIGRKLASRNLSDLAAMGARPAFALNAVAAGGDRSQEWMRALLSGFEEQLERCGAALIGGDLASLGAHGFAASAAVLGRHPSGAAARRDGGGEGERLYVTGALGGSILGRHLDFDPRVEEGRQLVEQAGVRCMIDLSDGLAKDLRRLCRASHTGARLEAGAIPIHADARVLARRSGRDPLEHALLDGEDYELLFSAAGAPERLAARIDFAVHPVGWLVAEAEGVALQRGEREEELPRGGHEHGG